MNDTLKTALESIKAFWQKFSTKTKIIFFSILGVVVVGAIVLTVVMNAPKFVLLYPSLDNSEAKEVVAEIEERGLTYKEDDGSIYVLESDEASLRMDLASMGHPYSTYNYDFFLDNVDAMTTDAERKIIENYQLTQKLETVIATIDTIERASVTINLGEDSGYVISNKENAKSSAGVLLTLSSGKELSASQVSGIRNLIAKSVPNLDPDDVSIVDTATGIELSASDSLEVDKSTLKLSLQSQYENNIENKIKTLLSKMLKPDNYEVVARCDIDVDEGIKEIITYTPSEDNRGVINHEEHKYTAQGDDVTGGGVPGTDSNTGVSTYSTVIEPDGDTIYVDSADTYDYLVSQMKEQIQKQSAKILSLNVSVVVKDKTIDEAQRDEIEKLVANAAGIEQDRVVVFNSAYIGEVDEEPTVPVDTNIFADRSFVILLCVIGAVLLIALILLFALIRSARKNKKAQELLLTAATENENFLEDPALEDFKIADIEAVESPAEVLKTQIQNFTSDNPEIAAQLVRSWLKGGEDDGRY